MAASSVPHVAYNAPTGRRLLEVPDKWTNCFDNGPQKVFQGFAADAGFYALMGSSVTAVEDEVASIVASANNVFYQQIDIVLTVTQVVVMTTPDSEMVALLPNPC